MGFIHLDTYLYEAKKEASSLNIMTPDEAAKVLKVKPETVRKWLRKGELTGANTSAGWRITDEDIEAWLAKYRRNPQRATTEQDNAL